MNTSLATYSLFPLTGGNKSCQSKRSLDTTRRPDVSPFPSHRVGRESCYECVEGGYVVVGGDWDPTVWEYSFGRNADGRRPFGRS